MVTLTFLMVIIIIVNFVVLFFLKNHQNKKLKYIPISIIAILVSIILFISFILVVPSNSYAQFNKRILGQSLSNGKIIATNGEMGPQSNTIREGVYFIPFINFLYDIEYKKIIHVPKGKLLVLEAKDGVPLGENEYFAPDWYEAASKEDKKKYTREEYLKNMLDATFFLKHGGKKGPQTNVIKPGNYAINTYLFNFKQKDAINVPTGFVGVVTSRVGKVYHNIERSTKNSRISVPLVDKGYMGIWKETLTTRSYYLNPDAYFVTLLDMRAQVWVYKGGYEPRTSSISVNKNGEITYSIKIDRKLPIPKKAADSAIAVKTKDKYTVYIEVRAQIQPDPKHASRIVAGIGNLKMVEDKVITPAIRSVLRNVGMQYNAAQFVDKRIEIEKECNKLIAIKARQAGVPLKEFYFGNIDLPPAVLIPQKVQGLSKKMEIAYKQQNLTYKQLVKTNETKATAQQQPELVRAKILKEKAEYEKDAKQIKGEGEKLYLKELADGKSYSLREIAKGQKKQVEVLGKDMTYQLQMWDKTISMINKHPEIATTIPEVFITKNGVGSEGGNMDEGAAIFTLQQIKKAQKSLTKNSIYTNKK